MSKFAIGDRVGKATDDHEGGVVVAVFPTDNGNFRYAVDLEGYRQRRAGRSITTAARLNEEAANWAALACFFVVFVGIECCQSGIA
jgi:hypothetical protein